MKIATLHSGYKGKLLEIKGEEFHLIITGNREDKKSQALKKNSRKLSTSCPAKVKGTSKKS